MTKKIKTTDRLGNIKVTFKELTVSGDTLTNLMLSLKKNEPETFREVQEDLRISMEEHLKK